MGLPALPLQLKDHRRKRKKAVILIEMAGADRQLRGHHRVANCQRLVWLSGIDAPRGGINAGDPKGLAVLLNAQSLQLPRIVTDQVRPGCPGGQPQEDLACRSQDIQGHKHPMPVGLGEIEMNLDVCVGHRGAQCTR